MPINTQLLNHSYVIKKNENLFLNTESFKYESENRDQLT